MQILDENFSSTGGIEKFCTQCIEDTILASVSCSQSDSDTAQDDLERFD